MRTAAVDNRIRDLREVLAAALAAGPAAVDLESLKRSPRQAALVLPDEDRASLPAPRWSAFEPQRPLVTLSRRAWQRRVAAAEDRFATAVSAHRVAEDERRTRVRQARRSQAERQSLYDADAAEQHARIDAYIGAVRNRDPRAVTRYFQRSLDRLPEPLGFPRHRRVGYAVESALLALDWDLPGVEAVPEMSAYHYDRSSDLVRTVRRPDSDRRRLYRSLVAQLALRSLHLAFGCDLYGVVDTVVFNGRVRTVDQATGQTVRPCLITVRATRPQFEALALDRLDPVACVRDHFAASVSPHPEELQPVEPVLELDLTDARAITPVDVISSLDHRPNLLDLMPAEFEHLVQNLLSRMGLETQVFRGTGDGGIDCVAFDPAPVTGGKLVVQAKLYTRTVPPAAVRDLFGTMTDAGATKGILITTSGFGPSSYAFANGKPLQLIDGTGLLALCRRHDVPARIIPRAS